MEKPNENNESNTTWTGRPVEDVRKDLIEKKNHSSDEVDTLMKIVGLC